MGLEGQNNILRRCPDYYLNAKNNYSKLSSLGFNTKQAGISVVIQPNEVSFVSDKLSAILGSDMKTSVPHFFLKLSLSKNMPPVYIARTILSTERDKKTDSIIREYGVQDLVYFFTNKEPYCVYREPIDDDKPTRLFLSAINTMTNGDDPYDQNVVILAGIGKSSENVRYGSKVIGLARIAISLVDWMSKNSNKPLFIISTTRLTNDNSANPVPQSYLLNRMFIQLGLNPRWLGMCVVRSGAERTHPTGAVLVQILPHQYDQILVNVRSQFNAAVKKMREFNKY